MDICIVTLQIQLEGPTRVNHRLYATGLMVAF
jgi:hypothetical protein